MKMDIVLHIIIVVRAMLLVIIIQQVMVGQMPVFFLNERKRK